MLNTLIKSKPERIYFIDWLRVLAVLLLILFHTARIFDIFDPFYVKNASTSSFLSYSIIVFLNQWQIPLLFLLAGASTWFALGFRSGKQYTMERLKRLLLPFLFGLLVIVPPQAYLARYQQANYSANYFQFLPDYFQVRGDLTGYTGLFTPAHLWFILFLLVFALVFLPVFLALKKDVGQQWISRLANWCDRPGGIYLFLLPLLVAGALPDLGGKNPFVYATLFITGFLIMANDRFSKIIDRSRFAALILGIITIACLILFEDLRIPTPKYSPADILSYLLRTTDTWFWIIAILGYGHRFLNRTNAFLRYANEATYPFYILHQTVIVAIGYFVVQWQASIIAKFSVIALASLAVTILLYETAVRRTNATRFLFGMKPLPRNRIPKVSEQTAVHKV